MDIYIGFLVLGIIFFIGFWWMAQKIKGPSTEDQKKFERAVFQIERLENLLTQNRLETANNLDKNAKNVQDRLDQTIDFLAQQLRYVNQNVDQKLGENSKILTDRLDGAAQTIVAVKGELGKMQEIGPHIKALAQIFHSPKLRGGMGEKILESVLAQRLPQEMWQTQYPFKHGETVDAAIFTQSGIIPIDAKFPLDNFRKLIEATTEDEKKNFRKEFEKDVKKQILDISKKYIRPDEGTTPFAIMYLPAEDIYYEAAIRSEALTDFSAEKNVTLVSPNIFYHFLGIVLLSLQSQKLNEQAGKVLQLIKGVKIESEKFEEILGVLGKHISNSAKTMERVDSGYQKLNSKIEGISEIGSLSAPEKKEKKTNPPLL